MDYSNTIQAIQDMAVFYSMFITIPFMMYAVFYIVKFIRLLLK